MRPPVLRPRIAPGVLLSGGSVVLFRVGSCLTHRRKKRIWCQRPKQPIMVQLVAHGTASAFSGPRLALRDERLIAKLRTPGPNRPETHAHMTDQHQRYPALRGAAVPATGRIRRGGRATPALYEAAAARPTRLLGGAGPRSWTGSPVDRRARMDAAARPLVRGRQAQRVGQLPRPAPARAPPQQGRDHLGGRAGRPPGATPTGTWPARSAARANALKRLGVRQAATGWRSTCR